MRRTGTRTRTRMRNDEDKDKNEDNDDDDDDDNDNDGNKKTTIKRKLVFAIDIRNLETMNNNTLR